MFILTKNRENYCRKKCKTWVLLTVCPGPFWPFLALGVGDALGVVFPSWSSWLPLVFLLETSLLLSCLQLHYPFKARQTRG